LEKGFLLTEFNENMENLLMVDIIYNLLKKGTFMKIIKI